MSDHKDNKPTESENKPKDWKGKTSSKVHDASEKIMSKGFSIFGDLSQIMQYSDSEEVEFMRSTRQFFYALVLFCVTILLWMAVSKLDVVSIAQGEITPSSAIKSVQHLEGGIIKEISIEEGDHVKKGDILLVLESTSSGASVTELASRIGSLQADVARLRAERDATLENQIDPDYSADLTAKHPMTVKQSKDLFRARQSRHYNEMRGYAEKMHQREQDVKEVEARLINLQDRFNISQERIEISEELLKDQLTNRYNHLELLREHSVIRSSMEEDEAGLKRAHAQLEEMKALRDGIRHTYLEDVSSQLEEAQSQLSEADERMLKLQDNLQRTVLTAPADGIIKQVFVSTVGGVVKPGETVIDIVPAGDRLVIEANLPVQDVGYVSVGQYATIRLSSSDAMRFDKIDGEVVFVAADTSQNEDDGLYYYKVRVETEQSSFKGSGGLNYDLYPGMQVVANIVTGKRTILKYVMSPFLEASYSSLQER